MRGDMSEISSLKGDWNRKNFEIMKELKVK